MVAVEAVVFTALRLGQQAATEVVVLEAAMALLLG
jgi:hypothetical protein